MRREREGVKIKIIKARRKEEEKYKGDNIKGEKGKLEDRKGQRKNRKECRRRMKCKYLHSVEI